ncbi:AAA family ATPase [Burkholderia pseudomallei]|uniref:AAA family ATPase n=1 Tax=Burkholderia pseudomallei TaxID=28450 RepID=UPI0009B52255|nr:AAA family ATPase [Burkholderia pseudomallei]CAJ2794679.1 ATPase [Burkholderia pseudomallei]CAJ2813997.1 ATPase [Burkholderia pseudomallei]CAJ2819494.1 ATPase [Burkholderia pseudomallei]CAJ2829591.1 ATPase [Burkholderia pseudomallei]CAJ2899854.1 ATPase [Burkholderia pseudomallei]
MTDAKGIRFTKYFPLLLDALRSTDPNPMRPAEVLAWIRAHADISAEDLTRHIQNGKQSIFENDVHWTRFYLVKAGLISKAKRGLWSLTPEGRETRLTPDDTWNVYVRIRDAHRPESSQADEEVPAPDIAADSDEGGRSYWFVGAVWNDTDDQLPRFLEAGIWENGYEDRFLDQVRRIRAGDQIAIKASMVKKKNLPFDVGGKSVSAMRIKATGTVLENLGDGRTVKVAWDPLVEPREWYFYTYRTTIVEVDAEVEDGRRLIDFTFRGVPQDYAWFLRQPYWLEKYGVTPEAAVANAASQTVAGESDAVDEEEADNEEFPYAIEDIITDGCFLTDQELAGILDRWRSKMNLILQGPPGTGKTWLAKRLGYALAGSNDRETTRSRLRVVQFHPSLAYEDFVRGWRPAGDGRLELVDGVLMQAIQAAESEPDRPFVLVIEEINRGNPAQIFGEMLTLLEASKRRRSEAVELAYRREPGERVHVPANLYVIGTMNVADRSLAIVDLALRRRFAFIDLEPRFGAPWHAWCIDRGLDNALLAEIENRIGALNAEIDAAISLGPQFRIGHSYVTPDTDELIADGSAWFRARVLTEIGPLLEEYWYDSPETAKAATRKLLVGLD